MAGMVNVPYLSRRPRVAILRLQGVIAATGSRGTLSHAALAPLIERAFRKIKPVAVALAINSPGGSPVQSALIAAHIRRLADETATPVHAFVEDAAASGGYWLACAADDIWVDESSITGSIGVISAGFGLQDAIARHGIERRVHTAGVDKSMLDPFRPERAEDVERLKALQARIHAHFIDHVTTRRGDRLDRARDDLFTGDIFVGREAVEAGLADGIAHMGARLREVYGPKIRSVALAPARPLLLRLMPGVSRGGEVHGLGADFSAGALDAIEARALWARLGL